MTRCGSRADEKNAERDEGGTHVVHRYLGLSLGGARSDRTCLTVIDNYRKQEKAFVVDIYNSIGSQAVDGAAEETNGDQVLLDLIDEVLSEFSSHEAAVMAVDVPLTLPPCLEDCEASCEGYETCKRPAVRWMRTQYERAKSKNKKLKHFTPYAQRPVDLYFRYKHPEENLFQDETMGSNLAPQAARMRYLRRFLSDLQLIEVWPKLTLFYLQKALKLTRRDVLSYRHIERGVHIRERVLERLVEKSNIFIYERDVKKFVSDIAAFDSLICAWVALQFDLGKVVTHKSDLPLESGWVQIPEL